MGFAAEIHARTLAALLRTRHRAVETFCLRCRIHSARLWYARRDNGWFDSKQKLKFGKQLFGFAARVCAAGLSQKTFLYGVAQ